jgi:hypothetical protein
VRRAAWALVAGIVALATLAPGRALASPEFPGVIESHLSLAYVPKCTTCHATNNPDAGPAATPFAASAIARGLKADDDSSLRAALDTMARDRVDSDGDRMRDIDELSWGLDPNVRHVPQGDVAPPVTYGCSATRSTGGGAWLVAVAAAIGFLVPRARWTRAWVQRIRVRARETRTRVGAMRARTRGTHGRVRPKGDRA